MQKLKILIAKSSEFLKNLGNQHASENQHHNALRAINSNSPPQPIMHDDDFANFTISPNSTHHQSQLDQPNEFNSMPVQLYPRPTHSQPQAQAEWLAYDTSLIIQGRTIKKGLIYHTWSMPRSGIFTIEPSLLINNMGATGHTNFTAFSQDVYQDDTLGYWPSYAELSPQCKGVYLDWLASERDYPSMPIGYVFIYFYGLEHRIIANLENDKVSVDEFAQIYEEVEHLLSIYGNNQSFKYYATNFLTLMQFSRPHLFSVDESENDENMTAESFRFELAKTVVEKRPIPASLALAWLKFSENYSLKTPARRCETEFKQLFNHRYKQTFGKGLEVSENKTRLKFDYRPASRLMQSVNINVGDLPDPSRLTTPVKRLAEIADDCTDILNPLSRYLAKENNQKTDLSALLLMPEELIDANQQPILQKFRQWARRMIEEQEGLVWVSDFWEHLNRHLPKTLGKKDIDFMHAIANKAGFAIAPDVNLHHQKPKAEGYIVLYQPMPDFIKPSNAFNHVLVMLRIGALVAVNDNQVSENEVLTVVSLIDQQERLTDNEKMSLRAYLLWQLNTPNNAQGLKSRLATLPADALDVVKRYILRIAMAEGQIDNAKIKRLEKLYTSLGFDKSLLTSDIHQLQTDTPQTAGGILNEQSKTQQQGVINHDVLAKHEQDTLHAQNLLAQIFASQDSEEIAEPMPQQESNKKPVHASQDCNANGLEDNYAQLFKQLISKEKWSYEEFTELCRPANMMPDAVIEVLNDWAYDCVDAPVIDAEEMIYIDFEIVEELQAV